jgi:hypothetical protein
MILTDLTKFDAYMFNLLLHKIKNTKSQYDADLALEDWALKGYRYNDDERIARMVVGNIFAQSNYDYEKANAKFISLNSIEIEPYIKAAVLDSASADYYYTYEKQW